MYAAVFLCATVRETWKLAAEAEIEEEEISPSSSSATCAESCSTTAT
jgi:hypothetical protein